MYVSTTIYISPIYRDIHCVVRPNNQTRTTKQENRQIDSQTAINDTIHTHPPYNVTTLQYNKNEQLKSNNLLPPDVCPRSRPRGIRSQTEFDPQQEANNTPKHNERGSKMNKDLLLDVIETLKEASANPVRSTVTVHEKYLGNLTAHNHTEVEFGLLV